MGKSNLTNYIAGCAAFVLITAPAFAADNDSELESAASRWSKVGRGGVPEYRRHVLPLIGRMGCNNRACHGSFQGQNGFRLSLFGSDPAADHKAFLDDDRIDVKRPANSLALLKPTRTVFHKGGKRFAVDSWQYRLFHDWIKAGARYDRKKESRVTRLTIEPQEIVLRKKGDKVQIRIVAQFNDGAKEDVTALSIFESKDDGTVAVSESGEVTAVRFGTAAIVATYGTEVTSCQALVARADDGIAFPAFPPNNHIDALVSEQLKKMNIRPSKLSTDEMFLRRVYLDVIGTLPKPAEVRAFLNDKRADKRKRLIDDLLKRPEYAWYWGTIFSDITGNQGINPHFQVSFMWQSWLEDKLAKNWSYDKIVGGILTATSLEGRPRKELLAEIQAIRKNIKADKEMTYRARDYDEEKIYAKRNTLDLYWLRIPNRQPERIALHTATAFLGIRFDCAQCHRHPFDRWTKDDFDRFQSFFRTMEFRYSPTGGPLPRKGRIHYGRDEAVVGLNQRYANLIKRYPPKLPGGEEISYKQGDDPRIALFEWMRSADNPYFAPALVNRFVKHYLGAGLVEPVEDFSMGNPASNPKLLNWLAKEFIRQKFDLKWLHRQILNSRTYQLSWIPNDSNRFDKRSYSHAQFRRLQAEVLADAIGDATGVPYKLRGPKDSRAIRYAPTLLMPYVLELFGRPIRKQTCGECERSEDPALNQALYMLTDSEINDRVTVKRGRLSKLKKITDNSKVIEELYLCTLSRLPTQAEIEESLQYRSECPTREAWLEDVLWALLNTREFVFNH